jgi:hypothetical protein
MVAHAAAYAAAGLLVLPLHTPTDRGCSCNQPGCRSVGKHPRTLNGLDDATANPADVSRWWQTWPDANIGLRPAEGTVVIDVDPRAGGDEHLTETLAGRQLPATAIAETGGGGWHAWYRCTGPYRRQLCPGVDLKGYRGYVVAPPSLHVSGRRYTWSARRPIPVAPEWLAQLISRPTLVAAPASAARCFPHGRLGPFAPLSGPDSDDGLVRIVAEAVEGNRNNALHWAACRAAERGAEPALLDRLRDAARSVGLDDREVDRTLRSAHRGQEGLG